MALRNTSSTALPFACSQDMLRFGVGVVVEIEAQTGRRNAFISPKLRIPRSNLATPIMRLLLDPSETHSDGLGF